MNTRTLPLILCSLLVSTLLCAQEAPQFTQLLRLTNNEVALTLNTSTGINYRIDVSTNLPAWEGLVNLPGGAATSLQLTDSAARYLDVRYYRAQEVLGTNFLAGDLIPTTNGDIAIRPFNHATFVMTWNGVTIYNDPTNAAAAFAGLPKADIILISHHHGDHYSTTPFPGITNTATKFIVTQTIYNQGSFAPYRPLAIILPNGASTNILDVNIEAVHAYNGNHPLGTCNGYVVTMGGKRVYIAGDTGNQAEIRALPNIDVAFVCMNPQFTMSVNDATNLVHAMRPKIVYPYHYRDSNQITNAVTFKQRLRPELGIDVRLRKWY